MSILKPWSRPIPRTRTQGTEVSRSGRGPRTHRPRRAPRRRDPAERAASVGVAGLSPSASVPARDRRRTSADRRRADLQDERTRHLRSDRRLRADVLALLPTWSAPRRTRSAVNPEPPEDPDRAESAKFDAFRPRRIGRFEFSIGEEMRVGAPCVTATHEGQNTRHQAP